MLQWLAFYLDKLYLLFTSVPVPGLNISILGFFTIFFLVAILLKLLFSGGR